MISNLPEHEFSNAERKRREDEIWNAAIDAAASYCDSRTYTPEDVRAT